METKRTVMWIALGVGLILLYSSVVVPWIDRTFHLAPPAPPASATGTAPTTQPTTARSVARTNRATGPATTQSTAVGPTIAAAPAEASFTATTQPSDVIRGVSIGAADANDPKFAIQVNLDPTGASFGSVVLNSFKASPRGQQEYEFEREVAENRKDTQALATRAITVNGKTYDVGGLQWRLVGTPSASSAVYAADLIDNGKSLLTIHKTFTAFVRSDKTEGYEVRVEYQFFNKTGQTLAVKTDFNGPTLPPPETYRSGDRQVVGGYRVDKDNINIEVKQIEEFRPDKDNGEFDLTKKGNDPAVWAGAASNYFGAIVLPGALNGGSGTADYIAKITARGVNIDKDTPMDDHQAFLTFQTAEFKVPPQGAATLPLHVYLGPKWRKILDTDYYASFPHKYDLMLIIRGGMCGFMTWNWLVWLIVQLMTGLHFIFHDWGLAIIGLVAIVRLLLHPITKRSQISMAKMGKMGPEMKRLQEKYKDDKEALNKAMMEFHKEQGLGPYLGCLPMVAQMPIWIALYGVLQSTFELRHAPFLWNWTWIHDLAQPDTLIAFAHPLHIFFFEIRGLNLLPLLLAVVMGIQQQFMPKPVTATPEQMKQQKMMQWLSPAMFLVFFYPYPSGLNLYIFASTAVGIVESKIVRDHIKQREEAEKAGRVFVETKPTRGSKRGALQLPEEPRKRGWLAERWGRLLEQAEQMKAQQERRGNGKKKF